ncbi:hypothetical protein MKX03_020419 [Papaver bracteatum]|nr:hypothetical protein MKX03_020419 [Papaver bracteatum]
MVSQSVAISMASQGAARETGTPNSGDCYPFQRPRVSVIALELRTDQDIRAMSDRYPPKAKKPEELETSFMQIFKDYTEAARNKEDCAPEFADCEHKLIKVIRQFINIKTVYHKFFPQLVNLKEVFPLLIGLLKDDKCGELPGQKNQVALLVDSLVNVGALEVFVSTLGKFSERDDLRAVENIAQILFQKSAAVATIAGCNSQLMNWVLEAITSKDCPGAASDKFVNDALELDIAIFPPSMDMIHESTMHFKAEIEEHLISLIESLTGGIAKTGKDILVKKFEENDSERFTWLMEHFIRYSKKVDAAANHLKNKQSIAVILGYLWSSEINAKIESELSRHQIEKKLVRDILSVCENRDQRMDVLENPDLGVEV